MNQNRPAHPLVPAEAPSWLDRDNLIALLAQPETRETPKTNEPIGDPKTAIECLRGIERNAKTICAILVAWTVIALIAGLLVFANTLLH